VGAGTHLRLRTEIEDLGDSTPGALQSIDPPTQLPIPPVPLRIIIPNQRRARRKCCQLVFQLARQGSQLRAAFAYRRVEHRDHILWINNSSEGTFMPVGSNDYRVLPSGERFAFGRARREMLCMRIAQVSPLVESVPPRLYGGTERVVSILSEALVRLGHEVTVYASGDSVTSARLIPVIPEALRLGGQGCDHVPSTMLMLERVLERITEYDVVHWHVDYVHFPYCLNSPIASLTTLHNRLDQPQHMAFYERFSTVPVVSISDAQRAPLPRVSWVGTVHHGLPVDLYRYGDGGDYLVFLGRMSPEKRPDRAIEIARRAGQRLIMAAKIDAKDREYFDREIAPLLARSPHVEFIGEVGDREKEALLRSARALLFPIDWPEPFGLVMLESIACGTPVIGFACGSVPEIIDNEVTGFIVSTVEEAVDAVRAVGRLDRRACRRQFEERFSDERMARDYLEIYQELTLAKRDGAIRPDFRRAFHHAEQQAILPLEGTTP
jgi:glycosyltransferase involved in cell wall biosynthesis